MIRLVGENPLKYENEKGEEVPVQTLVCSKHNNEIKFVVDGTTKIPVSVPAEEDACETWREELEALEV
jgi:hypothetical protein